MTGNEKYTAQGIHDRMGFILPTHTIIASSAVWPSFLFEVIAANLQVAISVWSLVLVFSCHMIFTDVAACILAYSKLQVT